MFDLKLSLIGIPDRRP